MTVEQTDRAAFFTFLSEDIVEGRQVEEGHHMTDLYLPGTSELTARMKVYKSGGENKMHSHPKEDHMFFVLGGQATFHIERDDNVVVVDAESGVLLPRGTKYWFTSTGEGNLVMLRVGTSAKNASFRHDSNGNEIKQDAHFPNLESRVLA